MAKIFLLELKNNGNFNRGCSVTHGVRLANDVNLYIEQKAAHAEQAGILTRITLSVKGLELGFLADRIERDDPDWANWAVFPDNDIAIDRAIEGLKRLLGDLTEKRSAVESALIEIATLAAGGAR